MCGDILIIHEGDRVPADAQVLYCVNLALDESLLTGESVPVRKAAWDGIASWGRPGGDDLPSVYSGSLVVQGKGVARVHATGIQTEMGKIGRALESLEPGETPLQKETGRIVRIFAIAGLSLSVLVVVIYGLTRGAWLDGFLAGIALAMAMLPEEFPVVLILFLALGAWRIAQQQVLTRRMPAIEALGAVTVLCVDKTGTLTLNRMSVRKLFAGGHFYDLGEQQTELPDAFHELLEFAVLASQREPFDPMDKSLKQAGDRYLYDTEHLHRDWTWVYEYPLSRSILALSQVWRSANDAAVVVAAKGAPEAIADLCHFTEAARAGLERSVRAMTDEGLRVLGVARAACAESELPREQHDFLFEFLGLLGFDDPVRPRVGGSVAACHAAGIRVTMITGDYPGTARHVAEEIGLTPADQCITGPELDKMADDELRRHIRTVSIFARVVPEQKLRLVQALKANGEIVAMTGDGVNDAPALKAAHIGIAMGQRGTDVARETAALVLLDDDFSSIVEAVRLGRRIFENLQKAMSYIFAIHIPIAGISLLPVLFQWPLVLLPLHIAFLELIIDPACSIAFEAEPADADAMTRPPRIVGEPLFNRRTLLLSMLQGAVVLLVALGVFLVAFYRGQGDSDARTLTFTTLIIANVALILTNRSWSRTIVATLRSPNSALWWVLSGTLIFLGLVLYVPLLRGMFRFSTLHGDDLMISVGAGISSILWFEALKLLGRRKTVAHGK